MCLTVYDTKQFEKESFLSRLMLLIVSQTQSDGFHGVCVCRQFLINFVGKNMA